MDSPPASSSSPSESIPPNAPKKPTIRKRRNLENIRPLNLNDVAEEVEEDGRPEGRQAEFWTLLAEAGHIREKFLRYVPEDIPNITDYDTLMWLRSCYSPSSQPHTFIEDAYCRLMLEIVEKQIVR